MMSETFLRSILSEYYNMKEDWFNQSQKLSIYEQILSLSSGKAP